MGWKLVKTNEEGEDVLTERELQSIRSFLSCSSFPLHADILDKINKATLVAELHNWENEGGATR